MTELAHLTISPELDRIASRIRKRIEEAAYLTGRDLLEAKRKCRHGEWLPFLSHTGLEVRTAQAMMAYARQRDSGKYEIPAHLPYTRFLLCTRAVERGPASFEKLTTADKEIALVEMKRKCEDAEAKAQCLRDAAMEYEQVNKELRRRINERVDEENAMP